MVPLKANMLPKISPRPLVTGLNCQSYGERKAMLRTLTRKRGIFPLVIEMMFKWQSIKEQIQDGLPTRSYGENYKEINNPPNVPL